MAMHVSLTVLAVPVLLLTVHAPTSDVSRRGAALSCHFRWRLRIIGGVISALSLAIRYAKPCPGAKASHQPCNPPILSSRGIFHRAGLKLCSVSHSSGSSFTLA